MLAIAGLLHWFTSPYVHQLDFNRELREGEAKTLSIFAQPQIQRFNESEIKFSDTMRPQVTFEVCFGHSLLAKDSVSNLNLPSKGSLNYLRRARGSSIMQHFGFGVGTMERLKS